MELSIFRFIIILVSDLCKLQIRVSLKYFCFQALSSVLILVVYLVQEASGTLLLLLLIFKLGIAPFHLWFTSISKQLKRFLFFWISIVQKIIPLRLTMILNFNFNWVVLMLALISVSLRLVNIITQVKLIGILARSSVFSRNWVFFGISKCSNYAWIFFMAYGVIQIIILAKVYREGITPRGASNSLGFRTGPVTVFILMLLISGFPPSPLFFLKLQIINEFSSINFLLRFYLIAASSVVNFCYIGMLLIKIGRECKFRGVLFGTNYFDMTLLGLSLVIILSVYLW